jgi:hypothetical protein
LIRKLNSIGQTIKHTPSAQLALIAGLSGLVYATIFSLRFPLAKFFNTIPPVDYTKLTHYSPPGLFAYVVGIGMLFWLYIWAVRLAVPTGAQPVAVGGYFVFFSSAILAAISVFSYPLTAIDLFIYAIRTRGWALYQLNPLATAPETLPHTDPWIKLAAEWADAASPYGPVWELLSLGAYYAAGGNYLAHLFALKIVAFSAYLGCVWLAYKTLQNLQPDWAVTGAIAFGWSPMVLLESVQNGHNDMVMAFFTMAAVWALAKWASHSQIGNPAIFDPWWLLVSLFLALSILVKFVTVLIVPFFLVGMALACRQWWRRLVSLMIYSAIIGGIVLVGMLPFWPGLDKWAVLKAGSGAGRSLTALLVISLRGWLGTNPAFDMVRNLVLLIFMLIYLFYLVKTIYILHGWRKVVPPYLPNDPAHFYVPLTSAFFVLVWYVLLATPVFHAWYLLWFIPLGIVLLPYRRGVMVGTVFSVTALLVIPYFETIRVWYPILLDNHLLGHIIGVPLLIVPPIVAIFWPISPAENSEV